MLALQNYKFEKLPQKFYTLKLHSIFFTNNCNMNENLVPISTLFIGINGFIAFALSYIVAMERTKTRVWHGESNVDVTMQPDYLEKPNAWAAFFDNLTQKLVETKAKDDGILQRKVRPHSNFTEYVPLALLLIMSNLVCVFNRLRCLYFLWSERFYLKFQKSDLLHHSR